MWLLNTKDFIPSKYNYLRSNLERDTWLTLNCAIESVIQEAQFIDNKKTGEMNSTIAAVQLAEENAKKSKRISS